MLLPKVQGRTRRADAAGRVSEALYPSLSDARPALEDSQQEIAVDAALTFSAAERLRTVDFEKMTGGEWEGGAARGGAHAAADSGGALAALSRADARPSIDLAATMRRMARDGGELVDFARRARVPRPPPLVVLCDISGSMERYTRMFLHFLHAMVRDRARTSTFVFGTRLTNVTRPLRDRDVDEALAKGEAAGPTGRAARASGRCLREFNFRWARRVLGQNACVMLVTDGLDRDDTTALREEMARLRRSCRRIVWLNPLLRYEGFQPSASGIAAMLPFVDSFLPMHNLASLADLQWS
jgi:uncharacterized protein with von Willebrand factor type A (vWA) domain